jgi:hypothetical protein
MPRGGKRPGAGRKPGHLNKRTVARQQLAASAAKEGISPLEVMLKRMRHYHSVAERELAKGENADPGIIDRALRAANESAKGAAPFLHPRLSAVEHSGSPVDAIAGMLMLIDGKTKGLPDPSQIHLDRDELSESIPTRATPEPRAPNEPVCRLDDDRADTIAGDAGKQGSEAGSRLDRIGTAHRSIVEPIDDYYAGRLGIAFDCLPLPCLTVLSVTHIGGSFPSPTLVVDEVRR